MRRLILVLAMLYPPLAGAEYKCVDERGLTHVGDIPPPACGNVVIYEMSKSGMVLRKIDPTPTPEQLKTRLEELERRKEADRIAGEQKRKDLALLNTYTQEHEIDTARDRNIEPIKARIKSAQERQLELERREQDLGEEMEFYKAGKSRSVKGREEAPRDEPPPNLVADLERVRKEKASLTKHIVSYEKEMEQLRVKYETDRKRWIALKSGAVAKPAEMIPQDPRQVKRNY
jgi:hypothetical protein